MTKDERYISRCLQLAKLGCGKVMPNPMVGAVLLHGESIIGEGYHQKYGESHAEVNCINSASINNKSLIQNSTLYVSLEPCVHYGKTPPCADLIIRQQIPKVVIGCHDIFEEVSGKGIQKLQSAGIEVVTGILEAECKKLNKRFFTFYKKKRPYIILKWAESENGKIAGQDQSRILISNEITNRLVHKWRSEEAAIMVGTNTALHDDPLLNNRYWSGKDPVRVIIDNELKLPASLKLFNKIQRTIVFNKSRSSEENNLRYIKTGKVNTLNKIMQSLFEMNIQSILVEGGAMLLQSFIDDNLWDEARVIKNEARPDDPVGRELKIKNGINAPELANFKVTKNIQIVNDRITWYTNTQQD